MTKITIITIFTLLTFTSLFGWENCPFGYSNDPAPGKCPRYIDTDNDGICDLSQKAPEKREINTGSKENKKSGTGSDIEKRKPEYNESKNERHEFSVEVEGRSMKTMSIREIAGLWKIDAKKLLDKLSSSLGLENKYTINTTINDINQEKFFSPRDVKIIAEFLKTGSSAEINSENKKNLSGKGR